MDLTDPVFWVQLIAALAVVAIVIYIVRSATDNRYAIKIVVDPSGVRHHRGLAQAQHLDIVEFLEGEFEWQGRLTILGTRFPNGYLKVDFRGEPVDEATQQKIRNYLKSAL